MDSGELRGKTGRPLRPSLCELAGPAPAWMRLSEDDSTLRIDWWFEALTLEITPLELRMRGGFFFPETRCWQAQDFSSVVVETVQLRLTGDEGDSDFMQLRLVRANGVHDFVGAGHGGGLRSKSAQEILFLGSAIALQWNVPLSRIETLIDDSTPMAVGVAEGPPLQTLKQARWQAYCMARQAYQSEGTPELRTERDQACELYLEACGAPEAPDPAPLWHTALMIVGVVFWMLFAHYFLPSCSSPGDF